MTNTDLHVTTAESHAMSMRYVDDQYCCLPTEALFDFLHCLQLCEKAYFAILTYFRFFCNPSVARYNSTPEQQRPAMELDQHLLPDSISVSARALDVDVRPLPMIYNAESVHLEPLSAKDWELLEIHADELESGSLLSQVCVIYPNQKLPIRLGRYGDIAWVKVLGIGFDRSGHHAGSESDSECSSDRFSNVDENVWHECLRLVANTEIVVVPKLRADDSPERSLPIRNLRVYPNDKDYGSEMKDLFAISSDVQNVHGGSEITSISIPKCPPWFTGAVHSSTFGALDSQTNGGNEANAIVDQNKVVRATITRGDGSPSICTKAVALIVIADDVPRGCIGEL